MPSSRRHDPAWRDIDAMPDCCLRATLATPIGFAATTLTPRCRHAISSIIFLLRLLPLISLLLH